MKFRADHFCALGAGMCPGQGLGITLCFEKVHYPLDAVWVVSAWVGVLVLGCGELNRAMSGLGFGRDVLHHTKHECLISTRGSCGLCSADAVLGVASAVLPEPPYDA